MNSDTLVRCPKVARHRRLFNWLCFMACLGVVSCAVDNGTKGSGFLIKNYGLTRTVIGDMELSKGLGLPFMLTYPTSEVTSHPGKPTIFLPSNVVDASMIATYNYTNASVVVILAPTNDCKFNYILISLTPPGVVKNPSQPPRRYPPGYKPPAYYFAREIKSCDHEVSFSADYYGVTGTESGTPDPNLWWISADRFTGPIRQSVLAARYPEPKPPATASRPDRSSIASNHAVPSAPLGQQQTNPQPPGATTSTVNPAPAAAASSNTKTASNSGSPRVARQQGTSPPTATPNTDGPGGNTQNTVTSATSHRLQLASAEVTAFALDGSSSSSKTTICLADNGTCGEGG